MSKCEDSAVTVHCDEHRLWEKEGGNVWGLYKSLSCSFPLVFLLGARSFPNHGECSRDQLGSLLTKHVAVSYPHLFLFLFLVKICGF